MNFKIMVVALIVFVGQMSCMDIEMEIITNKPAQAAFQKVYRDVRLNQKQLNHLQDINLPSNTSHLYVSWNYLKELPVEILRLKELKVLCMCGNGIETIPDEIRNLTNLSELWLSHNKIKMLPVAICALNLIEFNVQGNQIDQLPECPKGSWLHLKTLNLAFNKLKTVSRSILVLPKLREIFLQGNELSVEEKERVLKVEKARKYRFSNLGL
jgi:Leucine-rich repeat (LRR) protein